MTEKANPGSMENYEIPPSGSMTPTLRGLRIEHLSYALQLLSRKLVRLFVFLLRLSTGQQF
jgi:hypothetical protein